MTEPARGNPRYLSFERGERLSTRGACWTLVDSERGTDCTALRLWRDDAPHVTTLLAPFDRFRRPARHDTPVAVRAARLVELAATTGARSHPAGAVQAAAAARLRLLPYQLEPALAVLRHGATRVLIADAVGLGKTIQAGLLLAELARTSAALRALILVPAGLREQWREELARVFGLTATPADAAWLRAASSDRPADANPWALAGIYLASHDFVKRPEVLRPLEDVTWDLLVVDEAHACGLRTDRRAAAHAIALRADRVVLLTATPHSDAPEEFASLCSIGRIDPAEPPLVMFRRSRSDVGPAAARRSALMHVQLTADEEQMHGLLEKYTTAVWRESQARGDDLARLAALVLRKRALSSAASLALSVRRRMALLAGQTDPVREQLRLPLGDEEPLDDEVPAAVLAAPGLAQAARERRWLGAIAEAAQRASRAESKLRFIRRLLRRVREPVIVFTEYHDTLERLRRALAADGHVVLVLHGGMTPSERSRVQRRFNDDGAVLLATDAAAEGLNLHVRCRAIVHYELPWSISRLEQRAGRVDRLGQQRRVHELALVASSTAERFVLERLVRRAARARVAGDLQGLFSTLTEPRLAEIIVGGADIPLAAAIAGANPPSDITRRLTLTHEAHAEANRLAVVRDLARHSTGPAAAPGAGRILASAVRCRRSQLQPGIVVLYVVTLSSGAGRDVHVESVPLQLQPGSRLASRHPSPRMLQRIARAYANPVHPLVRRHISNAVERALTFAAPVHESVTAALQRRRAEAAAARTAAAKQLVQAGLFDWRAPAPIMSACVPATVDGDARSDSRTASSMLCINVRLAAVLFLTRR